MATELKSPLHRGNGLMAVTNTDVLLMHSVHVGGSLITWQGWWNIVWIDYRIDYGMDYGVDYGTFK